MIFRWRGLVGLVGRGVRSRFSFESLSAINRVNLVPIHRDNLHVCAATWIHLICGFRERYARRRIMCYYCGSYPHYQYPITTQYYPPTQYSGPAYVYPPYGYTLPYYALPLGYAITLPSPPIFYTSVPRWQRGEHRVGNCLMICQ